MQARTDVRIRIDATHARAICEEIGDRLREKLDREMTKVLPARLQYLIEQLAAADQHAAPSIAPSLDEMTPTERPIVHPSEREDCATTSR